MKDEKNEVSALVPIFQREGGGGGGGIEGFRLRTATASIETTTIAITAP